MTKTCRVINFLKHLYSYIIISVAGSSSCRSESRKRVYTCITLYWTYSFDRHITKKCSIYSFRTPAPRDPNIVFFFSFPNKVWYLPLPTPRVIMCTITLLPNNCLRGYYHIIILYMNSYNYYHILSYRTDYVYRDGNININIVIIPRVNTTIYVYKTIYPCR